MNSSFNNLRHKSVFRNLLAILVASFAFFGAGQVANAGLVSIYVNADGAGWNLIASGSGSASTTGTVTVGKFDLSGFNAIATDGPPEAKLSFSTFHIQYNGGLNVSGELDIAMIAQGFTGPTKAPINALSVVSSTNNHNLLTNVFYQSYVDSGNNGDPTKLASSTFTTGLQNPTAEPTVGGPNASASGTILSDLGSPYSISSLSQLFVTGTDPTEFPQYMVGYGGFTDLTATPEPSSISLVCLVLTGFSGYSWRRRRQVKQADAIS
jgi:hypothetical protein